MNHRYFCLAALLFLVTACQHTPEAILQQHGYLAQMPPSKLHGPGSLVYKRNVALAENQTSLGYICDPAYVKFPKPADVSPSEKIMFSRNRTFELSGVDLPKIGISAGANYVDSVALVFENTEIQEYSLEALSLIQDALGPKCKSILRRQQAAGNAYQVVGALKSDVSYEVKFKAGVTVQAQNLVKRAINAKLGLNADRSQGRVGKGLFYGVYLAPAGRGTILVAAAPR